MINLDQPPIKSEKGKKKRPLYFSEDEGQLTRMLLREYLENHTGKNTLPANIAMTAITAYQKLKENGKTRTDTTNNDANKSKPRKAL